jgi:hypothetical protein
MMNTYINTYDVVREQQLEMERVARQDLDIVMANMDEIDQPGSVKLTIYQVKKFLFNLEITLSYGLFFRLILRLRSMRYLTFGSYTKTRNLLKARSVSNL